MGKKANSGISRACVGEFLQKKIRSSPRALTRPFYCHVAVAVQSGVPHTTKASTPIIDRQSSE
jgi:hypothetical protein